MSKIGSEVIKSTKTAIKQFLPKITDLVIPENSQSIGSTRTSIKQLLPKVTNFIVPDNSQDIGKRNISTSINQISNIDTNVKKSLAQKQVKKPQSKGRS